MHKTSKSELKEALESLNVKKNNTYIIHSSLYSFGLFEGGCAGILEVLFSVLGPGATVLMPAFTFSYTQKRNWSCSDTRAETGALTEFFRKSPGVQRTLHPIHSVSVFGPGSSRYMQCDNASSFGPNNPFEKLIENKAINIGLGIGLVGGATFLHFAEECSRVPYRFHKFFEGKVVDRYERVVDRKFAMYSRKINSYWSYKNDWSRIENDYKEKKMLLRRRVGLGEIITMNMAECHNFLMDKLKLDPFYIAKKVQTKENRDEA